MKKIFYLLSLLLAFSCNDQPESKSDCDGCVVIVDSMSSYADSLRHATADVPYTEYKVPAVGTRCGMVVNAPTVLVDSIQYPLIVFHHGIGERGNGSSTDLEKLRINGSVSSLELNAKKYGFIVIEPQTDNNWEHGETDEALAWAKVTFKNKVNWNKVYITGLSLGGGGVQRYLSVNPRADTNFAAAVINCPGPNQYFIVSTNYKNIANTKVPMWYFHNSGDSVVRPSQSTLLTENNIKALGGTAQYRITLYNFTGHTWPSYNRGPGSYATVPQEATRFNNPSVNIYQWMLANVKGKPVMPPTVVPTPTPTPTPVDTTVKNVWISAIFISGTSTTQNVVAEITWSNGAKDVIKAATGYRIQYMIPELVMVDGVARKALRVKYSNKTTSTLYGPKRMVTAAAEQRPVFKAHKYITDPWMGK